MVRKKNDKKLWAIGFFFVIVSITIVSVELVIQNTPPQVMLSSEEDSGECNKLELEYYDSMNLKSETIYDDDCLIKTRIEYYDKSYDFDEKRMPWPKEVSIYNRDGSVRVTRYSEANMEIINQ